MSERTNRLIAMLIRLALVALVAAVYWPALGFGYVAYDDPEYVINNPAVRYGLSMVTLRWAFDLAGHVANWHPLTWLSLMLDSDLRRWLLPVLGNSWWTEALVHHAVNIILHAANVLLLFGLLRAMTGALWRSTLVAALLAVHPMHVESVAWVSERKDVLSMLFWLLALRAYAWYVFKPGIVRYLLVMLLMAIGLLAKPMAVTLPFALLLLDLWPLKRVAMPWFDPAFWRCLRRLLAEKVPLLAMSVAMSLITVRVQSGILTEGRWMTLAERVDMSLVGYARYLGKLFWPTELAALYPNFAPLGIDQWSGMQVAGAAALVVASSVLAVLMIRRLPYLFVGWFWFLGTLTPVIGLVHIGRQSMADRYTYIPYVGLYIALVWLIGDALARTRNSTWARVGVVAACLAIAALTAVAHRQVWMWRDNVTLFTHAIEVTDRNWMMLNNLGGALEQANPEEALARLREATEICTECAWVHSHYGEMLFRAGRPYEAQAAMERALRLDPDYVPAMTNLAMLLSQRGEVVQAMPYLRRVVELQPDLGEAHKNLAVGLALTGHIDEAIEEVNRAVALEPSKTQEYQLLIETIKANAGASNGSSGG